MAARLAHKFALANPRITADVVQVGDFPDVVERYTIRAVPTIVVNERVRFEGGLPEREFLEQVLQAVPSGG